MRLVWPACLPYLTLALVDWRVVLFVYHPDLGYWLTIVAVTVFLAGLVEVAVALHALRRTQRPSGVRDV